ncbi:hypothetical protein Dpo_3c00390 [Desulfotignum phosphitoxidans DSM 13687]|uniref:Uncharacterized protein n=1 Tax=Desulfotignum phosphitoxidans DSM 13687 TaxID=1286635 RepID=S0G5R2_9BACT|nr:hypothetical protein Dpo_3c00390 [Desulfotignum phosphitoxidans DSM 13687]
MVDLLNIKARECCVREKNRLVKKLRNCDSTSKNPEERHQCYRSAALKSGSNSRHCLISAM